MYVGMCCENLKALCHDIHIRHNCFLMSSLVQMFNQRGTGSITVHGRMQRLNMCSIKILSTIELRRSRS